MDPGRDLRFDDWTLVRPAGELVRGTTRVRLQSQPLLVLEALLAQPGEMVTREQLIARLWPNGVVVDFDTALNSAVRRLRTALEDHAESPRFIETIPRRGYRFIGHVHANGAAPGSVLPSPSDGTQPESIPAFSAAGSRFALTRATDRTRFVLLAGAVAILLGGAVVLGLGRWRSTAAPDTATATASPMQVPAEALERHERARFLLNRREPGDAAQALALLEQAVRIEPRYARAWAGIASVRWVDAMEGRVGRAQGLELTRAAAEQALQLDSGNSEALLRLANYYRSTGDIERGNELARRAEMLDPNDPLVLAFQAGEAARAGRFDEAAALQRRAVQGGPLSVTMRYNLAVWLFLAGRYEDARVELAQLHAISKRDDARASLIGQSMLLVGDYQGALEHGLGMPPGPSREQTLALAYHALGRSAESDAALQNLAASVPDALAYRVAEVHAYRGETDLAFEWLRRFAVADPAGCKRGDCWHAEWVPTLPLLQPLREDPRWALLMRPPAPPAIRQALR